MTIIEYIIVGAFLLLFEVIYMKMAVKLKIFDVPHHQSSHTGVVVRGGGIIFYLAFLLWSVMNGFQWYGGLTGLTIIASVSFFDDIRIVSPKIRLVCQFIAIILLFYHSGLVRTAPHVIVLLTIACVGAINIYNFMDGINGMTGGYSLIVALSLLYVDVFQVSFCDPDLLVYVIIALLVFCLFNFRRHAKCFAGDVGSLSIGFILVYLVLRLALRGHSMAWMSLLIVYAVDGGLTILHRIFLRENLMTPHKKHAYQIMANELKMPHLLVSGIYMTLQAICSVWYIAFPGYLTLFLQAGLLCTAYVVFVKKYYHLHEKKRSA